MDGSRAGHDLLLWRAANRLSMRTTTQQQHIMALGAQENHFLHIPGCLWPLSRDTAWQHPNPADLHKNDRHTISHSSSFHLSPSGKTIAIHIHNSFRKFNKKYFIARMLRKLAMKSIRLIYESIMRNHLSRFVCILLKGSILLNSFITGRISSESTCQN